MVELRFLHATHLLILGNMYVHLYEYRPMHNKVTERKGLRSRTDRRTDRRTDGQTDRRTDGKRHNIIRPVGRIKNNRLPPTPDTTNQFSIISDNRNNTNLRWLAAMKGLKPPSCFSISLLLGQIDSIKEFVILV